MQNIFGRFLGIDKSDKQHGMFIMVVHRRVPSSSSLLQMEIWRNTDILGFHDDDDDDKDFTIRGAINLSLTIS